MLINCKFNQKTCDYNDFYLYHNFYYGNCFRFNGGINSTGHSVNIFKSNFAGWKYGLQLELYINYAILSYRSGFRILFNNQTYNFYAFPEEDGISIPPGFISNIAISKKYIETVL
jgi:hypothetical protein